MKPLLFSKYESAGAEFDEPARIYPYRLWRMWGGGSLRPWRTVLCIMLKPWTADEHVLDPTLRRCEGFSRAWGYDGFEVCNLFALRSTDPDNFSGIRIRTVRARDGTRPRILKRSDGRI